MKKDRGPITAMFVRIANDLKDGEMELKYSETAKAIGMRYDRMVAITNNRSDVKKNEIIALGYAFPQYREEISSLTNHRFLDKQEQDEKTDC